MKNLMIIFLILAICGALVQPTPGAQPSRPISHEQMSEFTGGNFWGGLVCGAALSAAVIGTGAIITAATGGAALPLGMAFVASTGYHVTAVCLMIE